MKGVFTVVKKLSGERDTIEGIEVGQGIIFT